IKNASFGIFGMTHFFCWVFVDAQLTTTFPPVNFSDCRSTTRPTLSCGSYGRASIQYIPVGHPEVDTTIFEFALVEYLSTPKKSMILIAYFPSCNSIVN